MFPETQRKRRNVVYSLVPPPGQKIKNNIDLSMVSNMEEVLKSSFSKIAKGDTQAFARVFDDYYSRVFSTALQYCKIRHFAEDIAQQVFIILWEQRDGLTNINNPRAWLWNVTKNQTLKLLRAESTQQRYIDRIKEIFNEEEQTPLAQLMSRQQGEIVEKILSDLPNRQEQAYRMSRYDGNTYKEIGRILGISPETVKEHISKALVTIKHKLLKHKDVFLLLLLKILLK